MNFGHLSLVRRNVVCDVGLDLQLSKHGGVLAYLCQRGQLAVREPRQRGHRAEDAHLGIDALGGSEREHGITILLLGLVVDDL